MWERYKEACRDIWADKTMWPLTRMFYLVFGTISGVLSLFNPTFLKVTWFCAQLSLYVWFTCYVASGGFQFFCAMFTVAFVGFHYDVIYRRHMWRAVRRKN
jgi:hypothetical protein